MATDNGGLALATTLLDASMLDVRSIGLVHRGKLGRVIEARVSLDVDPLHNPWDEGEAERRVQSTVDLRFENAQVLIHANETDFASSELETAVSRAEHYFEDR
jgi:hypothetical protein